jgi:hypothetical protein
MQLNTKKIRFFLNKIADFCPEKAVGCLGEQGI